jgi:hypothetical protein
MRPACTLAERTQKLRITIRVLLAFAGLTVGLQAVPLFLQQITNDVRTRRMIRRGQFVCQSAQTLRRPTQRRLWITTGCRINQSLQLLNELWVLFFERLAPATGLPHTSRNGAWCPLLYFAYSDSHRIQTDSRGLTGHSHAATANGQGFCPSPALFARARPSER